MRKSYSVYTDTVEIKPVMTLSEDEIKDLYFSQTDQNPQIIGEFDTEDEARAVYNTIEPSSTDYKVYIHATIVFLEESDLDEDGEPFAWGSECKADPFWKPNSIEVEYLSGPSCRNPERGCDYMLAKYYGGELYAEMDSDDEDEMATYTPLKNEILEQAEKLDIPEYALDFLKFE